MKPNSLILFMGSEEGGIYKIVQACKFLKLPCGTPFAVLDEPLAARKLPAHHYLWYWTAIRRFFEDMGLPPIAPVPLNRITPEETAYYSRLFARTLGNVFDKQSFICADHLTSLVLPFVLAGMQKRNIPVHLFFFFSHPAREIALMRQTRGQAPQLGEFIWRNTAVSAILSGGKNIRFYQTDNLGRADWLRLMEEVTSFFPHADSSRVKDLVFPLDEFFFLDDSYILSPLTVQLYDALRAYSRDEGGWKELEEVARKLSKLETDQNGWQYVNCLDIGIMQAHARQLINRGVILDDANMESVCAKDCEICGIPSDQAGWAMLLESTERQLLRARQNFERELFLQCDNLHHFYMRALADEKTLLEQSRQEARERNRQRRLRHKSRLRSLWHLKEEKLRNT